MTFPARGTWIEIHVSRSIIGLCFDVPRKGNVDRNLAFPGALRRAGKTFPARGTWIEIGSPVGRPWVSRETFPARGTWIEIWGYELYELYRARRSPQGERG